MNQEEIQKLKEKKEAEKRNPLLRKSLGDLIKDMQRITLLEPRLLYPENELTVIRKYYDSIVQEINRRYPASEIDYDLIGRSLGAKGF